MGKIVVGKELKSVFEIDDNKQYLVQHEPYDRFNSEVDASIQTGAELKEAFRVDAEELADGIEEGYIPKDADWFFELDNLLKGESDDYMKVTELNIE